MSGSMSNAELDERIAIVRQNLNDLTEQAAGYSGGEDEERASERIAALEKELAQLLALRDKRRAGA